jgi:hypothetical protein
MVTATMPQHIGLCQAIILSSFGTASYDQTVNSVSESCSRKATPVGQTVEVRFDGAFNWLTDNEHTEPYETNYRNVMKRYPEGLAPYVVGLPVIT